MAVWPVFYFLGIAVQITVSLIFFIIAIAICVWVYKDARKRNMEATIWLLIVLLFNVIGIIIYLIVRKPITTTINNKPAAVPSVSYNYELYQEPNYNAQIPKVQGVKVCSKCTTQTTAEARFCPNCGNQV